MIALYISKMIENTTNVNIENIKDNELFMIKLRIRS